MHSVHHDLMHLRNLEDILVTGFLLRAGTTLAWYSLYSSACIIYFPRLLLRGFRDMGFDQLDVRDMNWSFTSDNRSIRIVLRFALGLFDEPHSLD